MKILYTVFILSVFFFGSVRVFAQTPPAGSFPHLFLGTWKGELTWTVAGKAPQSFSMKLQILPADSGCFTWQITYGENQQDNRPYVLVPVDTAKGHWKIDERNSIFLDSYWIGNRFTGAFSVQGAMIIDQYWLAADGLHVEFITLGTLPVATTGGSTAEIPPVASYPIRSVQRGVLKPQ